MQADGTGVVSELVIFVLALAYSLTDRQCSTWLSLGRTPVFSTISTLRCTRFGYHSCPESVTKTSRTTTERGSGERTL